MKKETEKEQNTINKPIRAHSLHEVLEVLNLGLAGSEHQLNQAWCVYRPTDKMILLG